MSSRILPTALLLGGFLASGTPLSVTAAEPRVPPELAKAQLKVAQTQYEAREKDFLAGRGTFEFVLNAGGGLLHAEGGVSARRADQLAAFEAHLERMKQVEKINKRRYDAGHIPIQDYALAQAA